MIEPLHQAFSARATVDYRLEFRSRTAEKMHSAHEFWIRLHELSRAYDAEGDTSHKRQENILANLEEMPRIARHEVFAELTRMMNSLQELYPEVLEVLADGKAPAPAPERHDRSA